MKKIIDRNTLKYIGKVALIALLIVLVIRCFFFEWYTISSTQMESTLIRGDEVLVNKFSYGARLPITPICIPFTFDRFLGVQSYVDFIRLPYKRLFSSSIKRNDIVLFNTPLEQEKPIDRQSLLISRCVGIPGDTIRIIDGIYYINKRQYVQAVTLVSEYVTSIENIDKLMYMAGQLGLELQKTELTQGFLYFKLNRYDAYILSQSLKEELFYKVGNEIQENLAFIVPSKGRGVILSPNNINIYKQIIKYEQGDNVVFEENSVHINNKKIEKYFFNDDYYWMLSDNTVDAIDSREIGFIPFKSVIGQVSAVLYNYDDKKFRSDRILLTVQ